MIIRVSHSCTTSSFLFATQKSKIELLCRSLLVSLDPYKVFLESYEILSKSMFFAPALLSECIWCSCEGQRCSRWWWSVPVQTLCCKFSPPLLLLITETALLRSHIAISFISFYASQLVVKNPKYLVLA